MKFDKKCSCCNKSLNQNSVIFIGSEFFGKKEITFYNCNACNSTGVIIKNKEVKNEK